MFPQSILKAIRRRVAKRRMREFSDLPIAEAFDRIYERGTWSDGSAELSGGGSYGRLADDYVAMLAEFIEQHRIESIVDIGCGDFNIGSRIAGLVKRYLAYDVSSRIIELNKRRFTDCTNVQFRQLDACKDPLETADLVTVRQVLQHLTNAQIESILRNIERAAPRCTLIAEHLSEHTGTFLPNLDLPSHSSGTRVAIGSGVVLTAPPFSRPAELLTSIRIPPSAQQGKSTAEVLGIFLLRSGSGANVG
jgi:2-polyprenyl-3-methyl-5-hydroxy-6-metoxy-1,4-benzoquinol methylase